MSIININNDILELTCGYQNCYTSQILIFCGYLKVREYLYTRVTIWVNAISNHIDTKAFLPRCQGSYMVYRPKWYWKQTMQSNHPYPTGIKKCKTSLSIPKWYQKQIIWVQHWFELIKTSLDIQTYPGWLFSGVQGIGDALQQHVPCCQSRRAQKRHFQQQQCSQELPFVKSDLWMVPFLLSLQESPARHSTICKQSTRIGGIKLSVCTT